MVGEEDVEPVQEREPDVEIQGHQLFHPGPQDLYHHIATRHDGTVDLAEARRRYGLSLELVEGFVHRAPEILLEQSDDLVRRVRRRLILEHPDGGQVRLGKDVGPSRQQLRELDEGGAETRHPGHQLVRPPPMMALAAPGGAPQNDPPLPVSQESHHKRRKPCENPNPPEEALHNDARTIEGTLEHHGREPRSSRKPVMSVRAVRKTVDATAGS